MKVGDEVEFYFAGAKEKGVITKIRKDGHKIIGYLIDDGKYRYNVDKVLG